MYTVRFLLPTTSLTNTLFAMPRPRRRRAGSRRASASVKRAVDLLLLAGASAGGCTYGQVKWGGDPVDHAYVSISNCDAQSWNAYTSSAGWYAHDGHDDTSEIVSEGLILIMSRLPNGTAKFDMAWQEYESCPDDSGKLCDRHDMDFGFKPMSPWEWNAWRAWLSTHNTNSISDFFTFCRVRDGKRPDLPIVRGALPTSNNVAIERATIVADDSRPR
ncbi:MAG: hypothetical protein V3V08_09130 [Nannocystaceae bacterium]